MRILLYTQFIEKSRVFKFLSGLNSEFDHIRVQILEKDKLPSLTEVKKNVAPWLRESLVEMIAGAVIVGDLITLRRCVLSFMGRRRYLED